jgi:hypothetical protein
MATQKSIRRKVIYRRNAGFSTPRLCDVFATEATGTGLQVTYASGVGLAEFLVVPG